MDEKKRRILEKAGLPPKLMAMIADADEAFGDSRVSDEAVKSVLAEVERKLKQEERAKKPGFFAKLRSWLGI